MKIKNKLLLLAAFTLFTNPAHSYDEPHMLFGLELFDFNDADESEDTTLGGNLEYRSAALDADYPVSWLVGVDVTGNGDTYTYFGFLYDIELSQRVSLTPNVAAGYYHQHKGQDLGGPINFRSSLELNYKITPQSRIGLSINHHSNASIYSDNPGMESSVLSYSFGL